MTQAMTDPDETTRMTTPLSRLEIMVLARLARPKPPSEGELAKDLQKLALPDYTLGAARAQIVDTLAALRERGLVEPARRVLAPAGRDALRDAFGLSRAPTWSEVRSRHAAALALGLAPGSVDAQRALASADSVRAAVLARRFGHARAADVRALCLQLLFDRLQLPVRAVRDSQLLAHVLAHHAGVEPKGDLDQIAGRLAAATVGARNGGKAILVEALARAWVTGRDRAGAPSTAGTAPAPSTAASAPSTAAPPPSPARDLEPASAETSAAAPPAARDPETALADAVRAALARVPAHGRFGEQKVFISSLWDELAREVSPAGMDLARFKRWLLDANARHAIVLARADLVGAMDPAQVAASEIVDRGASFHFVLDQR